ncbi:MAG: hypothetical protein D6710_05835 [Nitrospirae bacterium]|nr:MAG: hypothetical protein D6710_05835 [Nitrospirota bacterium]
MQGKKQEGPSTSKKVNLVRKPTFPVSEKRVSFFPDSDWQLSYWAKRNYKNRVLLLIDRDPAIRSIPEHRLYRARILYEKGKIDRLWQMRGRQEEGFFNRENYLYLALGLGIVREVYWVVPFDYFKYHDAEKRIKRYLQYRGYDPDDIASFRLRGGCLVGNLYGFKYHICGIEGLPEIDSEEILLTIDLSFFPLMERFYRQEKLLLIKRLFEELDKRAYRIGDVSIVYSVEGGGIPVESRYIGDVIKSLLLKGINQISDLWAGWRKREIMETLTSNGSFQRVLKELKDADDEADRVFLSLSYGGLKRYKEAMKISEQLCSMERDYCYLYPRLGAIALSGGDIEEAGIFFRKALKINPPLSAPGLWDYAMALFERAEYQEALKVFNYIYQDEGSFRADLMAGLTCMRMKDPVGAEFYFDRAVRYLKKHQFDVVWDRDFREAIKAAEDFYRNFKRSESERSYEIYQNLNLMDMR